MKILVILTLILTQSAFSAVDWTKKDGRDIYDVMYLPQAKTWFIAPNINFLGYRVVKKVNNVKIAETENKGTSVEFVGGYSFRDDLSLTLDFNYLINSNTEYDNVALDDYEEDSKGLSDPTFQLKYRALDQKDHKVNLDFIPRVTFGTGDRDIPSATDDGNNKIGGLVYGLNTQAGVKFNKLQFMAFFNYTHFAESKLEPVRAKKGDRNSYEFGGQAQVTLNEKWFFSTLVSYTNLDSHKETFGTNEFIEFPRTRSIKVMPEFFYQYDANFAPFFRWELVQAARYTTTDENGAEDTEYGRVGYSKISIGARYQF